jgi:hypothetical protein
MPKQIRSRVVIKKPKIIFKDLKEHGVVGLAYDYRDGEGHKAEVEAAQTDRELWLTTFHEVCGHLTNPELSERQVIKLEKTVGVALWKVILRLRRKWLKNSR